MASLEVPFVKTTLPNGLDVIVHEDHHVPVVAVNIWYRVGSKNERRGRTGFAHLFEHLMFEGSEHHNSGYFQPLQRAGASLNGSTSTDRTNYWEVVPTNAIDLALWMESDRMGHLLPAVTAERFETQRDVVMNERRQNYENRPYGLASMAIASALYPSEHPYSWPTIGTVDDLEAMKLEDVHEFFRSYYHTGNASLAIAGDIETERALDLAAHYFGDLSGGTRPARVSSSPVALDAEVRLVLEDRVELPRVYMAWHSPAMFAAGDAEMDLLGDVLASGKTSRLYRDLVYDRRIALDVSAYQSSREIAGNYFVVVTAAPEQGLQDLVTAVDEHIMHVRDAGPTADEMERAMAHAESQFVYQLQTVGGFGGKSDQLNAYNTYVGDPGYFEADLARYRRTTAAGIQEAASRVSTRSRVVLSVIPKGRRDLAVPGSEPVTVT